jgi:hypothetical protein
MQKSQDWLRYEAKSNAVSLSMKKINSSLGDYLSAIKSLKRVDKETKRSR